MENSKRPAKEVLNGSASSRQGVHRREGATRDVSTALEHRVDLVHDDLRPCGDPDSLQSKEALVG